MRILLVFRPQVIEHGEEGCTLIGVAGLDILTVPPCLYMYLICRKVFHGIATNVATYKDRFF